MSNVKDDAVVTFIGKRRTGKSWLVRDLLYYHQDIPVGTVISPTERCNKFYSDIVPPLFIHDEFQSGLIGNIISRQHKIINAIKKKVPEYIDADPRTFLIFDDCLYDNTWKRNQEVRYLFMNGRHVNILFLITMQHAMGITPELRNNIDYIFLCRSNICSQQKRIYEHYAGMFPSLEMFTQVMNQCTEDFECLVINNVTQSNQLEDQVFWYKADTHENFHIGAEQFWNYNNQYYKDENENEEENGRTDWRNVGGKKNKMAIQVKKNHLVKQSQPIQQKQITNLEEDDIYDE